MTLCSVYACTKVEFEVFTHSESHFQNSGVYFALFHGAEGKTQVQLITYTGYISYAIVVRTRRLTDIYQTCANTMENIRCYD